MDESEQDQPASGDRSKADSELLRGLVAEALDRIEEEGERAVDSICEDHPELAAAVRRRLSSLRAVGLVDVPPTDDAPSSTFPDRLGEFRLIRRLGGGGMGVVYLAEQESLGRQVALKLIRPEHLYFPGARGRFQREAEAVARLHHPGIVPIHSFGEEKGLPYFSMELVEGCSLAEVMERIGDRSPSDLSMTDLREALRQSLPDGDRDAPVLEHLGGSWTEACFRVIREVATALTHAHQRGVLHRDLKPSNIMITREGRVLLLDFGLASLGGASRMTRTGFQLGSVAYMSPEQVRGDMEQVDERSDVYSLGATLYELLTLRLPYPEQDSQVVQQRIVSGGAIPPRDLNRDVPADAETVCQKAMEVDPARRYASAADLARDLSNFLELRPVEAVRPGILLRLRRWSQRRPALAVALLLGAVLVLGGPTLFGIQQHLANRKVQAALAEAESQFRRAEANLEISLQSVDQMLTRLASRHLASVPQMTAVRRDVLKDALRIFEDMKGDQGEHPAIQIKMAETMRHIADLQAAVGEFDESNEMYRRSLVQVAGLVGSAEFGFEAQKTMALTRASQATVFLNTGRLNESEELYRQVRADWEELRELHPERPDLDGAVAGSYDDLARVLLGQGKQEEALDLRASSIAMFRKLAADENTAALAELGLTSSLIGLAATRNGLGDLKGAEAALVEAIELGQRSLERAPEHRDARSALAGSHASMAYTLQGLGRREEAAGHHDAATVLLRGLVRDFPALSIYRNDLGRNLMISAELMLDLERRDEAEERFREAEKMLRRLVEDNPPVTDYRTNLANCLGSLADVCARSDRRTEAVPYYLEAIALVEQLIQDDETASDTHLFNLGLNVQGLSYAYQLEGNQSGFEEQAVRAVEAFAKALEFKPMQPSVASQLGVSLVRVADHYYAQQRLDDLLALTERPEFRKPAWAGAPALAASFLCDCILLMEQDQRLGATDRQTLRTELEQRVLEGLRRSRDDGASNLASLFAGRQLELFRDHQEFQDLLKESD